MDALDQEKVKVLGGKSNEVKVLMNRPTCLRSAQSVTQDHPPGLAKSPSGRKRKRKMVHQRKRPTAYSRETLNGYLVLFCLDALSLLVPTYMQFFSRLHFVITSLQ